MLQFLLTSKLGRALGGLFAGLLGLAGIYLKGRSDAVSKAKLKGAEEYKETRKRIDEADSPDNVDDARKLLHERGKR